MEVMDRGGRRSSADRTCSMVFGAAPDRMASQITWKGSWVIHRGPWRAIYRGRGRGHDRYRRRRWDRGARALSRLTRSMQRFAEPLRLVQSVCGEGQLRSGCQDEPQAWAHSPSFGPHISQSLDRALAEKRGQPMQYRRTKDEQPAIGGTQNHVHRCRKALFGNYPLDGRIR